MATVKLSGIDRLIVETYSAFWDILGSDSVIVWAQCLRSRGFPFMQAGGAHLAILPILWHWFNTLSLPHSLAST